MTLVANREKLTGSMVRDNFNVDQAGNLAEIEPRDAHEKITLVRPNGNGMDI